MKLHELFEPERKIIDIKNKDALLQSKSSNKKFPKNHLGSGAFSHVTNAKDEHLVNKTSKTNPSNERYNDAFWDYADAIIKSEIWKENPYFPRFYSIKEYKTKSGSIFKGTIEKLVSYSKLSSDILVGWLYKVFDMDKIQSSEFGKTVTYYINNNKDNSNDDNLTYYISALLIKILRDYDLYLEYIKDEKFIEALNWIKKFAKENNARYDLHDENIMFRKNAYGLQLVFTDPLVYSK